MTGSALHVETTPGTDPVLVLLHRGLNSLRSWDPFVPGIACGRRLVTYDRRGFGASPRDAVLDARLFHRDADDLAELLEQIDATPAHLVGHSDGATVALVTAARHPEVVRSVTAIAGHLRAEEPLRRLLLESPLSSWGKRTTDECRERHGDDWRDVAAAWYELWTSTLADWDIEAELAAIRCPVLVVHDKRDVLAPPDHGEGVARSVPHAVLSWYDTGRHGPHVAERERFERELEAHLRAAEA